MGHFQFLKQKKFYFNLLIILLLCIVLFWLAFILLDKYTRHDKVYNMPNLIGRNYKEVQKEYSRDFHFILIDSVYPKGQEPGSIIRQDPLPDSKVKKGRNVYYIIVAENPEQVEMPNLKNLSLRQAIGTLESKGLEIEWLQFENYFAKNAIIDQLYQGSSIEPGTIINKGSGIVLRVGKGDKAKNIAVPNLIGRSASDAKRLLHMAGLNLKEQFFEDSDSLEYQCISKMMPGPSSPSVPAGTEITLWFRSNRKFNFDKQMDELLKEDSIFNHPVIVDTLFENDTIVNDPIETTDYEYEDDF